MNLDDLDLFTPVPLVERCRKHRWVRDGSRMGCQRCGAMPDPRFNRPRDPLARFAVKVADIDFTTNDCQEWLGQRKANGYGVFNWGAPMLAHRAAWALFIGAIPAGMVVMHTCDNPPCVRLGHLRLGRQAENVADMVRKGRSATGDRNGSRLHPERLVGNRTSPMWGESNGHAKLSAADVVAIRQSTAPLKDLATRYGVNKSTISRVRTGKRWPHV